MADDLARTLQGYQYTALLEIARFNGIATQDDTGRGLDKAALIRGLLEKLFTAERVSQALQKIGHLERAVLHRALVHGDELNTEEFRNQLDDEGIVSPGTPPPWASAHEGDPYNPTANAFEDVIARLTLHGLLLSSGIPESWGRRKMLGLTPGMTLIVPSPVRCCLPEPMHIEVEWGRGSLPAPLQETDIAVSQRDLFIYWSTALARPLPLTQAGLVRKRSLRQVNEQLLLPDPAVEHAHGEAEAPRIYFLRLLLQDLGLLAERDEHLEAPNTPGQIPEFWREPVLQRAARALESWMAIETWSELLGLSLASLDLDLLRARRTLLEQLGTLPVAVWISAERFSNRLLLGTPSLLVETHHIRMWAAVLQADDEYAARHNQRLADIQSAFVGRAVSGPLHWLGIVDIALDDDRLLAFRITKQGGQVLNLVNRTNMGQVAPHPDRQLDDEGRVVVQPSFHILVLGPVPEFSLAQLELFAERLKADRSAFEYVLSQETVYRGQQSGLTVDGIVAALRQMSSVPIPTNVLRSLRDWDEQYQRIVFHKRVALMHTSSAGQLEELWQDTSVRRHLGRRLTPTVATVRVGHRVALRDALFNRGVLAALSHHQNACVGRVRARPSGELVRLLDGPDLLLEACLAELAEMQDGIHVITQGAVTQALQRGMTVLEYLNCLARVNRGPLPDELRARIKAWGHYYGKATLRTTTLLEVQDASVAQELLTDPALAVFLSPFPSDPRGRLLLVQSDDLSTVRELLTERGVDLT